MPLVKLVPLLVRLLVTAVVVSTIANGVNGTTLGHIV